MPFNASLFLFGFLPAVLLLYLGLSWVTRAIDPTGTRLGQKPRNTLLFAVSLFFYAFGEGELVLLMLGSILSNWALGLWLGSAVKAGGGRLPLALGIALNLGLLGWFKYANFFLGSWVAGWEAVLLPIGISFYTFQAISYLVDVKRGEAEVQRNPIDFGLYISLFPQLIAGPIVRYHDLAQQLTSRHLDLQLFSSGARRFMIGLAKKVLIADTAARTADAIFGTSPGAGIPPGELSVALAWAGTAAYSVQIYFDFSGYSDMAIGLGRMLGFRLLENFRWPYVSRSITEYWRRWHISLSTWFRDYLYIPLGGNRGGAVRTYVNLVAIFLLCGLWHGAEWTFVVWGGYQGLFLVTERLGLLKLIERAWRPLGHLYMHLVLLFGWVIFRSFDLNQAGQYFRAMFGGGTPVSAEYLEGRNLDGIFWLVMGVGAVASLPVLPWLGRWRDGLESNAARQAVDLVGTVLLVALFGYSLATAAAQTQSPFIYFRF